MLEPRRDQCLAPEALAVFHRLGQSVVEQLDDDPFPRPVVQGEVQLTHAATLQEPEQPIPLAGQSANARPSLLWYVL